jgi:hypothetical protein
MQPEKTIKYAYNTPSSAAQTKPMKSPVLAVQSLI